MIWDLYEEGNIRVSFRDYLGILEKNMETNTL